LPTSKKREQSTFMAWRGMMVAPPGCCGSHAPTSSTIPSSSSQMHPAAIACATWQYMHGQAEQDVLMRSSFSMTTMQVAG
jgi:hypothetical protein